MTNEPSPSVQRVQEALRALGFPYQVVELSRSARTAAQAADAIGCRVEQIASSLVFRTRHSGRPILIIASGGARVDEGKLAEALSEPVDKADAAFVRDRTGFAIGGVAPVGHAEPLATLIDADLLAWDEIWAAGGHPSTVFKLAPGDLVPMTGGRVVAVR